MIPIVGPITSELSGSLGSFFVSPITGQLNAATLLNNLQAQYNQFSRNPVIVPSSSDLFAAYNSGFISLREATWSMLRNGIVWGAPDVIQRMTGEGVAPRDPKGWLWQTWEDISHSKKIRPSIALGIQLFTARLINLNGFERIVRVNGGDWEWWGPLAESFYTPTDLGSLIVARNRGVIDDVNFDLGLERLGYHRPMQDDIAKSLRETLPGVQDLVRFAVRDLWDKEVVDGRKLTEEFPHQLQGWANKLGLFGESDATTGAENRRLTQAEMYWASHWQNVAAGQAYDMFHRLRPGRIDRFTAAPYNLDIKPFELADLRRTLKIDDYAPGDRDYLTAIAFQPLQVRYVVKALGLREEVARDPALKDLLPPATAASVDSYNRDWAIEQFRDRGLHVDDAAAQADLAIVDAVKKTRAAVVSFERSVIGKSIRSALESYKQGAATRVDVKAHLLSQGVSEKYAEDALRTVEIEAHTAIVKSALSSVRHDYFSGVLAPSELLPALLQSGVQPDQAQWFAARWTQQRNRTRRTATTQQLLAWLKEGLIGQEEAHLRMLNLGWTEHDALIQLQGAAADVLKLQGKLLSAQQAQRTKAAKAAEKVAKDAKKVADTALKHARGQWTQAMLKSAFKKGVINADFVRQRLSAQGHDGLFIDVFLRDSVTSAKPKATSAAT